MILDPLPFIFSLYEFYDFWFERHQTHADGVRRVWSLRWAEHQENVKANTGESWVCSIITQTWKEHHKMWLVRCTIAHEDNENNKEQQRRRFSAKVTAIYAAHDSIDAVDRIAPFQKRQHGQVELTNDNISRCVDLKNLWLMPDRNR